MRMVKKRHPFRGLFFGFLLGLGLALMAIIYGFYLLGPFTPWILLIVATVLGLLMAFVPRPWGNRRPPVTSPT